jgi:hypothetical protein
MQFLVVNFAGLLSLDFKKEEKENKSLSPWGSENQNLRSVQI